MTSIASALLKAAGEPQRIWVVYGVESHYDRLICFHQEFFTDEAKADECAKHLNDTDKLPGGGQRHYWSVQEFSCAKDSGESHA
jgi:hypothetical protein